MRMGLKSQSVRPCPDICRHATHLPFSVPKTETKTKFNWSLTKTLVLLYRSFLTELHFLRKIFSNDGIIDLQILMIMNHTFQHSGHIRSFKPDIVHGLFGNLAFSAM